MLPSRSDTRWVSARVVRVSKLRWPRIFAKAIIRGWPFAFVNFRLKKASFCSCSEFTVSIF